MRYKTKNLLGFTVIELMITIVIAAVLLTVGVPSFNELIKQNNITTQTNTIIAALNYARNETITQNDDVTIQPIIASSTDWTAGWQITADGNTLRFFDAIDDAALQLSHPDSDTTIVYRPDGSVKNDDASSNITLTLTPNECTTGEDDIRLVTVSLSGHPSISRVNCP